MVLSLWAMVALGTLLFLVMLALRASIRGGLAGYRSAGFRLPGLLVGLVALSVCWPWTLGRLMDELREQG